MIAEGPQLLPSLVAPLVGARDQALFLVPSRERQHETLAARGSMALTSDPAAARAKLAGRNALIAGRIAAEARELGLPVLEADRDLDAMIELAVERLAPAIARGPHGGDLAAVRRFENDVLATQVRAYRGSGEAPSEHLDGALPFACECGGAGCDLEIELSLAEYEALSARGDRSPLRRPRS